MFITWENTFFSDQWSMSLFLLDRQWLTQFFSVVREIDRINEAELRLGSGAASWHEDYKDSAYIFVGGLHFDLTEGDVIAIFSQCVYSNPERNNVFWNNTTRYGEVLDVNLPRDKETGKTKGFGFLMYEDQRSTTLAVDNLNGAKVLGRTLRVDHVKNYKQPKVQNEDGEWVDAQEQSLNAKPQLIAHGNLCFVFLRLFLSHWFSRESGELWIVRVGSWHWSRRSYAWLFDQEVEKRARQIQKEIKKGKPETKLLKHSISVVINIFHVYTWLLLNSIGKQMISSTNLEPQFLADSRTDLGFYPGSSRENWSAV